MASGPPADRRLAPDDPRRARLVARECPAARRGRLRRALGLGPLHGPGRPDRARRRELDDPCRWPPRATQRVTVGPFVLNVMNRHPAVVARMASTLQIASGGRLDPRHRDRRRAEGARGLRHRLPGAARARRPARGGRRGDPGAVDRRAVTRDSPYYPLTTRTPFPVPAPPPPIIIGGETPAGARLAGRIGDGWTTFDDNFEQNLPRLPRVARGDRPATRGPARARRLPGRLAGRRGDRGRPVGAATRARRGSDGRRPARTARSCSPERPPTSTLWSRPPAAGRRWVSRAGVGTARLALRRA